MKRESIVKWFKEGVCTYKKSLAVFLILFLSACNNVTTGEHSEFKPKKTDVVDIHGQADNRESLDTFIEDVNGNKEGAVRVVRYTIEGDPIFYDLEYSGNEITLVYDTTHDQYGSGTVDTNTCKRISKVETDTTIRYLLHQCEGVQGSDIEILGIDFDVQKQDRFEFELKYGENLEEVLKSDAYSPDTLQKIYKVMVLNSYLNEKKLKTCSSGTEYELTVWINGAKKEFKWGDCDKENDAVKMTEIVNEIIKLGS